MSNIYIYIYIYIYVCIYVYIYIYIYIYKYVLKSQNAFLCMLAYFIDIIIFLDTINTLVFICYAYHDCDMTHII